ncbi:hypothetical protein SLNWT_3020 [Streptomyces albus]|uniref:Uncharacterized protein n=1 Tax=Streptomyces albus (strain ATCC 21838 / DSM 41398 / FERM P-419 / JCM 4703 / NBRC 107858) TaxID=1081613 RepID=A0A0B5EXM9_STRA4|nr:hypothetical protein SLNWT_3020 [Streptomyces albus]AOU77706.1 hypothetical protein SLNHY_3015 [Streptomyces albus]
MTVREVRREVRTVRGRDRTAARRRRSARCPGNCRVSGRG